VTTQEIPVTTGGRLAEALAAALAHLGGTGRVYDVAVAHDDGCPCIGNEASMRHCTCELVVATVRDIEGAEGA
jgi:hypothetical protein